LAKELFPGWESLLPGTKVSPEVAKLIGHKKLKMRMHLHTHPDIRNDAELKEKIRWLKDLTSGTPVGAKIGCGILKMMWRF